MRAPRSPGSAPTIDDRARAEADVWPALGGARTIEDRERAEADLGPAPRRAEAARLRGRRARPGRWVAGVSLAALVASAACAPAGGPVEEDESPLPPGDGPPPPPKPPPGGAEGAPEPPAECGDLPFAGTCDGDVVRWCEDGAARALDCAHWGMRCGWVDDVTGNYCTDSPADGGCDGLDGTGVCEGAVAVWCDAGERRSLDCAARGESCGWVDETYGYFCGGQGERPSDDGPPPDREPAPEPPGPEPEPEPDPDPADPGPPPDPPADDPCRGLDYLGTCEGSVAVWCEDQRLQSVNCANQGQPCGWVDGETGYFCGGRGDGPGEPPPPGAEPPPLGDACGSQVERAVAERANQARASAGLGALACDETHVRAARAHSQDMCDRGYFSHTGLDGSQPWDRLSRAGADFGSAGENIAMGYQGDAEVHQGWMTSAGHRANILGRGYRRIGVGFAACGGRNYWTQVFSD